MGREVRRVPKNWEHPKKGNGHYQPMHDRCFKAEAEEWDRANALWRNGEHPDQLDGSAAKYNCEHFEDWDGERPDSRYYMPNWPDAERTHLQMYECTSAGTPISPVMETPEELAQWLVDNNASSFASQTASYEAWLRVAKGGWAPSAVAVAGEVKSGVEAIKDKETS